MSRLARIKTPDGGAFHATVRPDGAYALIEGDLFGEWRVTDRVVSPERATLLAPVAPPNVLAIGLNYRAHAKESGHPLPERPVLFIKANTAVCGPDDAIVLPREAPDEVDYECELAIVVGKRAKHVGEDEALDYVLGYTCANDVSARDCQLRLDAQWARGKSFDTFAPMGPWIETDLDADNARIRTRLNGRVMQDSSTNDLIFSCAQLVSYLSQSLTLLPGTVIMTGTPSGVGFARKPPVFLRAGDTVEVEIDGIGTLRNTVVVED